MAELHWSLLCRRGIVDKFTNYLSLLEVVNEILVDEISEPADSGAPAEAQQAPGMILDSQLVSLWTRSDPSTPERFWQRVTVTTPDGETHGSPEDRLEGDLSTHQRTRLLTGMKVIPYRGPGIYVFNIFYAQSENDEGELVDRVPLDIKVKNMDEADTG